MNVLITGATGGIGKALVDIFVKNNYHVIAIGRNKVELDRLQQKYHHMILCYSIDITNENEINSFFQFLRNNQIKVHILINGAGIGEINYFEKTSYATLKKMMEINMISLTKFTSYFYKEMQKNGGTIVNISSTAGFQSGGPYMSVYYATKSYVNSLTLSLYQENKNKELNIVLLAPGPTKTNFIGIPKTLNKWESLYITSPVEVAQTLYKGLKNKRFLIIPGKINKILYYLEKFMPIKLKLYLVEKIQKNKINQM